MKDNISNPILENILHKSEARTCKFLLSPNTVLNTHLLNPEHERVAIISCETTKHGVYDISIDADVPISEETSQVQLMITTHHHI